MRFARAAIALSVGLVIASAFLVVFSLAFCHDLWEDLRRV